VDPRTRISPNSCATEIKLRREGAKEGGESDGGDPGAKGMEMCQQWLSVAGLVLDVIGFLIIAFEWRHTYLHSVFLREAQVQERPRQD